MAVPENKPSSLSMLPQNTNMQANTYFPPPDNAPWASIRPEEAGFDPLHLDRVIAAVRVAETSWPIDIGAHLEAGFFDPPPFNEVLGPVAPRGPLNGLLLHGGRMVARWGDTRRVDMTFSVTKSYLSLLAGLATMDGLIADLDDPVGRTVDDGGFAGDHNSAITWRHLLQQTSEWEGTLFGKADQIDRNRVVGLDALSAGKGEARPLRPPGTFWEYNDVRVNRLSLALLRRFGRALPEVFAERIMGPIGASSSWHWEGYRNSFVEIGGRRLQSVSGGGHWGGGMFIHAEDQARLGLLMLRKGRWGEAVVLPEAWIDASVSPCPLNPLYGFMWWLNTNRGSFPGASAASVFGLGSGGNLTWIDPDNDIVAVLRWTDTAAANKFMAGVTAALRR
jgi:CubicO group peptidase (beta-lactamase class C family)